MPRRGATITRSAVGQVVPTMAWAQDQVADQVAEARLTTSVPAAQRSAGHHARMLVMGMAC